MRIKFHIAAGLVTIVLAVALFFVLGGLTEVQNQTTIASAEPEFMQVPAGQVSSDTGAAAQRGARNSERSSLELQVLDLFVDDTSVWIATPVGLVHTDHAGKHVRMIDSAAGVDPTTIYAIAGLGNQLLFCTDDKLYEYLGPDTFHAVDLPFTPPIVTCTVSESTTFVGSHNDGVLAMTLGQVLPLKSDLSVTAIVRAPDGIWVGTNGDGLWFFNGEKWQKRFLHNDTTAFDDVTALAYRWPQLWVGTRQGLFRYNGGRWDMYTGNASAFPGGWVTDLALAGPYAYIGTADRGLWIFDGTTFAQIGQFAGESITRIKVDHREVFVGTQNSGVHVLHSGKWRPLYPASDTANMPARQWTLL